MIEAPGTYPLVVMKKGERVECCVEGMVITAGAVFDWLAHGLGIIADPADSAAVAAEVTDAEGVYVLPALQGLGSPHFDPDARMHIGGLSRGSTRAHVVRAAMEGVAFRVREMLDAIYRAPRLQNPGVLRADGGAAANDALMQIQADVLGVPVERMDPVEATAYGAALLAGLGSGVWSDSDVQAFRRVERIFEPRWADDERDARYATWRTACSLDTA
jgi:glycerol kinase